MEAEIARLAGPGQDALDRSRLVADLVISKMLTQSGDAKLEQRRRRVASTRNGQRPRPLEEPVEQIGVARHRQVQVVADLASERRGLGSLRSCAWENGLQI